MPVSAAIHSPATEAGESTRQPKRRGEGTDEPIQHARHPPQSSQGGSKYWDHPGRGRGHHRRYDATQRTQTAAPPEPLPQKKDRRHPCGQGDGGRSTDRAEAGSRPAGPTESAQESSEITDWLMFFACARAATPACCMICNLVSFDVSCAKSVSRMVASAALNASV